MRIVEGEISVGSSKQFDPEGNIQRSLGNTFICPLSPSSEPELYSSLLVLYDKFKNHRLSHLYALLPPSSWHDEECTSLFEKKLSSFHLNCDPPYHLFIGEIELLQSYIELRLEPYTTDENARLRDLRDRLSTLLRIRKNNHNTYIFHLTTTYLLRFLTKEQNQELTELFAEQFAVVLKQFELGSPEFCTFNNMFAFKRLLYLKDH
ncbi:RNA ligase/cyclic nucleotide phosphodiesterase [Mycena galopus ATCC 62051]|nr:RNA ligase/cyclic nucleotide phosphodiesterase [Mycena galopus ATCC 62051]